MGIASEPLCLVGLDIVSITTPKQETELEFINNFSPYLTALEWKNIAHAGSSEEMLAEFYRYMNFEFDHHYDSGKNLKKEQVSCIHMLHFCWYLYLIHVSGL